jgi:undecaprenyl pyrophosphate phosphatase UppP
MSNIIENLLVHHIGAEEVIEESDFMKIMIKALRYLNAPIMFLFLFKQDILPNARLYEPLPPNEINFFHRIWMVILIAFIPSFLLGFNYKNKKKVQIRRYTNSVCIWILMFAVLVLLYSKPYISTRYVLIFLLVASILIYSKPPGLSL